MKLDPELKAAVKGKLSELSELLEGTGHSIAECAAEYGFGGGEESESGELADAAGESDDEAAAGSADAAEDEGEAGGDRESKKALAIAVLQKKKAKREAEA